MIRYGRLILTLVVAAVMALTIGVAYNSPPRSIQSTAAAKTGVTDIPREASRGVTIGNNQNAFRVEIPEAAQVAPGIVHPDGVVTYLAKDHADDTVVPTEDGAQFFQVIESTSAPAAFSYQIDVPKGGRLLLVTNGPDGHNYSGEAALILNAAGAIVGTVDQPWAHDARGRQVTTYFTARGTTLTQHVLHRQPGVTYPVTADPNFHWYALGVVITLTYNDMVAVAASGIYAAEALFGISIPTAIGVIPASVIAGMLTTITAGAAWGVATHKCLWFWFPYPLDFRGFRRRVVRRLPRPVGGG